MKWGNDDEKEEVKEEEVKEEEINLDDPMLDKIVGISDETLKDVPAKMKFTVKAQVEAISQDTDDANRAAAWGRFAKSFGGALSAATMKALKAAAKVGPLIALLCLMAGAVRAQDLNAISGTASTVEKLDLKILNIGDLTNDIRTGTGYNQHGEMIWAVYFPFISVIGPYSGDEYVNLNIGAAGNFDTEKGDFAVLTGFRIDTFLSKLGRMAWPKRHLKVAVLPALEASALGSWSPSLGFYYGGILAYRLGGK